MSIGGYTHALISGEDLARYRLLQARIKSMELKPSRYLREEVEQAYIALWRFYEDVAAAHEVDDSLAWGISLMTGLIRTGGEWVPE